MEPGSRHLEYAPFLAGVEPPLPLRVRQVLGLVGGPAAGGTVSDEGPPPIWGEGPSPGAGSRVATALAEDALRVLQEVLESGSHGREAAFRLLTADALLTWACEAGAQGEEPGAILEEILVRVGGVR